MPETQIQRARPVPKIIKDESGKERTSTGRWSNPAIADYVAAHPETMFDYKVLARLGYRSAFPKDAEAARQNIRAISNLLESRGILSVVEFAGRKIHAIQIYIPLNEYHQKLMADEIARRKLRADGSADKLEALVRSLPEPKAETEEQP